MPGWNAKVNGLRRPSAQIARFCAGRRAVERVVGRDRAVGVDAQDLAEPVRERLRVGAVRVVADGDVELAVRPEVDRAAVVVGRAREVVEVEEDPSLPATATSPLAVKRLTRLWTGERRSRVVDVDEVVDGEVRVEGDAEQAALAGGVDGHA